MIKLAAKFTALAAFAWGCTAPLSALTFDFSYVLSGGQSATGSFEGTQVGGIVEDISNISLVLNGVAITGPIQAVGFGFGGWSASAVAGFSAADSNFIFTDRNPPPVNGTYGPGENFFFLVGPFLGGGSIYTNDIQTGGPLQNANGGSVGWTLTARTTEVPVPGVPDTASTAALLGLALAGSAIVRRRMAS